VKKDSSLVGTDVNVAGFWVKKRMVSLRAKGDERRTRRTWRELEIENDEGSLRGVESSVDLVDDFLDLRI